MTVLSRFRRTSIWDVRVGDVVRYNVLYQSRSGFIVRLRGSGRIDSLSRHIAPEGREPAHIEGLLRDGHGIVQRFNLTEQQRLYRRVLTGAQSQTGGDPRSRQITDHESRGLGKAV
jgi:hypothetical protein